MGEKRPGAKTVMLVDDEDSVLASLRRLLRPLKCTVLTASRGREALDLIDQYGPPTVIVSDQCMPEMTGVSFLTETLDSCPDTIRILLTAKPDLNTALDAFDKGIIDRFVTKPWDPEKLRATIKGMLSGVWTRGFGNERHSKSSRERRI